MDKVRDLEKISCSKPWQRHASTGWRLTFCRFLVSQQGEVSSSTAHKFVSSTMVATTIMP